MQSCQFAKSVSEKGQTSLASLPFSDITRTLSGFVVFLDRDLVPYLNSN